MAWFSDLMILKSFFESSGCWAPRKEAIVKRCLGADFSPVVLFFERVERDRCLDHRAIWLVIELITMRNSRPLNRNQK
jgi:hypothetical protein